MALDPGSRLGRYEGTAPIWIYELSGASPPRRLTFQGHNRFPVWSNDGTYVAFQSDRDEDRFRVVLNWVDELKRRVPVR